MKTRLTKEELAKAHGGLCGTTLGDGPCSCLVHWVEGLQKETDDANLQLSKARKLVQGYRDHSLDYGKRSKKGSREEYTAACQLMIFDEILERWPKHITNERCTCPDTKLHGGEKALCPWCKSQRAIRKANDLSIKSDGPLKWGSGSGAVDSPGTPDRAPTEDTGDIANERPLPAVTYHCPECGGVSVSGEGRERACKCR